MPTIQEQLARAQRIEAAYSHSYPPDAFGGDDVQAGDGGDSPSSPGVQSMVMEEERPPDEPPAEGQSTIDEPPVEEPPVEAPPSEAPPVEPPTE